jgi:serine/threonine protein kinase/Tol biopolymer transport system component
MTSILDRLATALSDRYRIERELGAGGMATVYLAEDVRHDRKVALKVLKPELAAVMGADRFLTEIRTTANLQHPHILPLFDSGEADGLLYYVMPYIEGESLRERLDREKQLPVDTAVSITTAVAGALDYAHRQGVIHRDIKPANILMQDGQPVVADFGIALAVSAAGGDRMTETGLSLGTPFYMSPEQATADRDLNAQSDIYALACVLYEMLTGSPPFTAPTAQAVVMQIITAPPKPVTEFRKSVPEHVEWALEKALEKLPADRFANAGEFAEALNSPGSMPPRARTGASEQTAVGGSPATRFVWPAAAAALLLGLVFSLASRPGEPEPEVARFFLDTETPQVASNFFGRTVAISPDGRVVAFVTDGESGNYAIGLRRMDTFSSRILTYVANVTSLDFSPDSRSLAFNDGTRLMLADLDAGGRAQPVAEGLTAGASFHWGRDGYIYFLSGNDRRGRRLNPATSQLEDVDLPLADPELRISTLEVVPGTDLAVFASAPDQVGVVNVVTGEVTSRFPGRGALLVSPDIVVWQLQDQLLAQRIDLDTGVLTGRAVQVTDDLPGDALDTSFDVADAGHLVYRLRGVQEDNVILVNRNGTRRTTNAAAASRLGIRASPGGTRLAFEETRQLVRDLWIFDLESGTRSRLTFEDDAAYPVWSPDGQRVAYFKPGVADDSGQYGIYQRNADGSGIETLLFDGPGAEVEVAFVPGSSDLVIREGDQTRELNSDIILYRDGDPEQRIPLAATEEAEVSPVVSPDGNFVAYTEGLAPNSSVIVRSLSNPEERWQIAGVTANEPWWGPDGTEIYYRSPGGLYAVPVSTSGTFRVLGEAQLLFETIGLMGNNNHTSYSWSVSEQAFVFLGSSDLKGAAVVLNWSHELGEQLGVGRDN